VHKTNEWLKELNEELREGDREDAWRILRGYLQVLRDHLTMDEGAQLAAQLPLVVRGALYDGFDPGRQPVKPRDRERFLADLQERAALGGRGEAVHAAEAVSRVLHRKITPGELDDVLSQLPTDVREILQAR
jgi:uncharacterized protein (DUF2267 family)